MTLVVIFICIFRRNILSETRSKVRPVPCPVERKPIMVVPVIAIRAPEEPVEPSRSGLRTPFFGSLEEVGESVENIVNMTMQM